MRCLFVCADDFLWRLAGERGETRLSPVWVVEEPGCGPASPNGGRRPWPVAWTADSVYRRAFRTGNEPVLLAIERARQAAVVAAIRRVAPSAPLVVLAETAPAGAEPLVALSPAAVATAVLEPALERAVTRARVERVRAHFDDAERVLIMMQDDPDPDAIASAWALRTLLGRTKTAAPIATFGTITRPENRAMTRILEIDVERIAPRDVGELRPDRDGRHPARASSRSRWARSIS